MNREVQTRLMQIRLDLLLYGRTYPAFRCDCGCIQKGEAKVTGVIPPKKEADQSDWLYWKVDVEEIVPSSSPRFTVGLAAFLEEETLNHLFHAVYSL